ncbi:MAG: PQQ-binding-like beta-propeller repeat protein [Acidobacteriota bacterium]
MRIHRPLSLDSRLASSGSRLLAALTALLLGSSAFPAAAESQDGAQQWAGYRGPGVIGVAQDELSDFGKLGLKVAWKTEIGSGYSGIAVAEGKAVTMYSEGESDVMAAFDIRDGRKLWTYAFAPIYTGHDGSHDGPIATPLIADGRVFGLGPRGQFFGLDANTGRELWKRHLADDHGATKPHYGFGTSPILEGDTLLLQLGGEGQAMAGFDPATGELKWSAGSDTIGYQVPVPMKLDGTRQIVAAGENKLFGFDTADGSLLWEWPHGGEGGRGAHSMTPVPLGDDRILLAHRNDSSTVVAFRPKEDAAPIEAAWAERSIRNSYNVPIFHDGHIYAFSSRFLTCVDAATGESRWRSREPGDGFLIGVGGKLVIVTKKGSVHLAEATPEGYRELAATPVFNNLAWSAPSFSGGSIYARSLDGIARIDFAGGELATGIDVASRGSESSAFGRFLAEVDGAADDAKAAVVDRYLEAQKRFPIVEGERQVHFIYRGPAEDVAVAGDPFGARQEHPMTRVSGTDLFYATVELAPDARVNYMFLEDYSEILDPRNPRQTSTIIVGKDMEISSSGEEMAMSWLAMPDWRSPAHLEAAPADARGRLEDHELESKTLEEAPARPGAPPRNTKIALQVYLPKGYDDDGDARYPVAYVHDGNVAVERGHMPNSLDNVMGESVAPTIVVFVNLPAQGPLYDQAFVGEVVPFIDSSFRTRATPEARANVGTNFNGITALVTTLSHPDTFGAAGTQSLVLLTVFENMIQPLIENLGDKPPTIYMDWGTYDMRNPHENWDTVTSHRQLVERFEAQGVDIAGGEVPDGSGWSSWRNRTDQLFAALFPMPSGF